MKKISAVLLAFVLMGSGVSSAIAQSAASANVAGAQMAAASRLVITGATTLVAGDSLVLTITAREAGGAVDATYNGPKSLTFSGADSSGNPKTAPTVTNNGGTRVAFGGPTLITFVNGVATAIGASNGVARLYKTETAIISVSDGVISSAGGDRLTVSVSPAPLAKFFWAVNTTQTNGVAFTGSNTLTAQDAYGNAVVSFNAQTDAVTISPSGLSGVVSGLGTGNNNILNRPTDFSSGVADLTALGMKYTGASGTGTFGASSGTGKTGTTPTVTINPGPATKLVITGQATQTAGNTQNLTITAKDTSGNVATSYSGAKSLVFSGANSSPEPVTSPTVTNSSGTATNFGTSTSIAFSNGVATVSGGGNGAMRLYKAESASITVTDGSIWGTGANGLTVNVSPASLGKFNVNFTTPQKNTLAFTGTNTITALDDWGNVVTTFNASSDAVKVTTIGLSGAVSGLGAAGDSILNTVGDFASGVANVTGKLRFVGVAGTGKFRATSTVGGKSGTSGDIVIQPGDAKRFTITGSATQVAGTVNNLTITARDTSGNVATAYTGIKQLTFSGANPSPDPTQKATVNDNGGSARDFGTATDIQFTQGVATSTGTNNGAMKLYRAETATVAVTDGSVSSSGASNLSVTVSPGSLGKFGVVMTSPQANAAPFTGVNTITALDDWGNVVTTFNPATNNVTVTSTGVSGTITGLGSSGNNVLNQSGDFSSGVANVTGKLRFTGQIGSVTFTATSANAPAKTGTSGAVTIQVGAPKRIVITGSSTQTAGATQNLTLTLKDTSGNTVTTFSGDKSLTFSGSSAIGSFNPQVTSRFGLWTNFGAATTITFTNGVSSVVGPSNGTMRLYKAGTDTISVTDGTIGSAGADRLVVTISEDALAKFAFALASPQANGLVFTGTNTLTAQDQYGNPVKSFNAGSDNVTVVANSPLLGVVSGLGQSNNNVLNQPGDFVSGVANLTGKIKYTGLVGTGTFTASSSTNKTGTSTDVAIVAGGATRLVVTGSATQTAGGSQNLTIAAKDGSGNIVTTYAGFKSLTFSGADTALLGTPPTVTDRSGAQKAFGTATELNFVNGVSTVSTSANGVMRLYRAQAAIITVTDGTLSASGDDRLSVTVSPAALGKFALELATPQINGVAFTGANLLKAQDDWSNTVTTFSAATNPVTVTALAPLTGTVFGLGTSSPNVLDQAGDFVLGVANLNGRLVYRGEIGTGTFSATAAGKTGTSLPVQILPGGAKRLVITGNSTQVAGSGQNIVITARDSSGNISTNYTGLRTLTFSGADTSFSGDKPTVSDLGGTAQPFGTPIDLTFVDGVAQVVGNSNGVLKLYRAQQAIIVASDGSITSTGADRLTVTVSPGPLGKFALKLSSPQKSGVPFFGANTLTAQDDWANPITTFDAGVTNVTVTTTLNGTVSGLGSLANNVLNRGADFVSGVADLTALGMKYTGATGTGTFTATGGGKAGTSDAITIEPGRPVRLVITGNATQQAGASQNLTITAKDTSGNVATSYVGDKTLIFSGAKSSTNPVTPPSMTNLAGNVVPFGLATILNFTNGTSTVSGGANGVMKLYRADTATIQVTDGSIGTTGPNDPLRLTVTPAPLGQFFFALTSPQINGTAFTGTNTLTAQDDWGNAVTTFVANVDNVTLTARDTLSGTLVGLGSLGNNVLNRASDFVSGVANLTALGLRFKGVAGTGKLLATSAVGTKTGISSVITINNPVPTLTSISGRVEASRVETVSVVLQGTNFVAGVSKVSFGADITVTKTAIDSTGQLTTEFVIGAAAVLGPRNVTVTNPAPGGGVATLTNAFTVKNIPNIVSLTPAAGIRGQTLDVLLTGTNFADGVSTVGIMGSNITLNSQTVVNPTRINANITIGLAAGDGVRQFTVSNSGTYGGTSNTKGFTVGSNPKPTVTSVTPTTAVRLQSLDLVVKGNSFFNGITSVDLGKGIGISDLRIDSTTQLRVNMAISDSAATGPRSVVVVNSAPGGGIDTLRNGLTITNPLPSVTGISVQNGSRLQTLNVTLTGARFIRGVTTVTAGPGVQVGTVTVENSTQLSVNFVIDSSATLGAHNVIVSNPSPGGGSDTLRNGFTVNNPVPTITAISPDSTLLQSTPLALVINGTNFVPGTVVRLGTDTLTISLVNRSRINATVRPADLDTARAVGLTTFNPAPGGGTSNVQTFTVLNPAPTLASIAPGSGSRLQTLDVVFTGTNFVPGVSSVTFSGSDITINKITVNSTTQLTANITIGSSAVMGARDVSVANPAPGGGPSVKRTFTIANNPVPTIASVTPAVGSRLATLDVIFRGTNFITGVSSPDFGGTDVSVTKVVVNDPTQLTATIRIPANAATGKRNVSIVNAPPGGGTATKTEGFEVVNPSPTLASVSPANGQQLQTINVVFRGTGFINGVSSVGMGNGISVNSQTVVSDTQITANVTLTGSASPGPREVYVTNLGPGGGTAILPNGFVVGNNPKPTLTSVNPSTGKRLETLTITLRGTNFVGGVTAIDMGPDITVTRTTVDSLQKITATVKIQPTATTGARTVYVSNAPPGGGIDSLDKAFTVTNPAPTLTSVTPNFASRQQTLNVVMVGSNFISGATTVDFGPNVTLNSTSLDSASRMTVNITIGNTAATGGRNVVVANPAPGGGSSNVLPFTINLAAPQTPILHLPTNGSIKLPTTLILRWRRAEGAANYHLQVSPSSVFQTGTIIVDDSLLTDTLRTVGPLQNSTTYYWRVRARNSGGTSSYSSSWQFTPLYPLQLPLSYTWPYPSYSSVTQYKATDYQVVGLPGVGNVLIGSLLTGNQGTDWQLYWDNGAPTEPYYIKYDGSASFMLTAGRAYWLIRKGAWSVSTTVASAPLDNTQSVAIQVHKGWNMITNPFDGAVPWSAVQAVNGALARGQLWAYNGSYSTATSMEPYTGYYFFADSLGSLRIPYGAVSGVLKADETPSNLQWTVGIELRGDEFVERATSFGISDSASEGLDQYDYRKPRAIGDIPGVSFRRPDLDADYSSFARDIRPAIHELSKWTFEVRSTDRKTLTLAFDRPEDIPAEYDVYVIDLTRAKGVDLRSATEYSFTPVTNLSEFAVVVGSTEAVQRELNAMLPREFALGNNFPNPFNPSTTIPVSVPQAADVTLKVFNILGEEIRALHDGPLEAGRHWFMWDGRNGIGGSVASGVYFVRMTTNSGKKFVGKMLLMK